MSLPTLTPASTLSAVVLPVTGAIANINSALPYKIYSDTVAPLYSAEFLSGAMDQVSYVYKKLGGDILDIELTEGNVYAAYEEAVLEYSYLINVHQATNVLSDALGNTTGSFDSKGNILSGELSSSLGGTHVALKYPKFDYSMVRRTSTALGAEIGLQGTTTYSASIDITKGVQDYDLQALIESRLNVSSAGSMTFTDVPASGSSFTLTDANGRISKFAFDDTIAVDDLAANPLILGINGLNKTTTAELVKNAINTQTHLGITATRDGDKVEMSQDKGGTSGDTTITLGGTTNITAVNFTGGADTYEYGSKVGNKKILIKKVYYKTPHAMWRFFGYYGGLNVVGNLNNYGQFSDDSTFQLVPAWHNKAQAMAFEDAIYTRMSHYTYELRGSTVRLFPIPYNSGPSKMWFEFSIPEDVWDNDDPTTDGVNNMNTLPIGNLPFENINAIGKQWIRRFALALSKETLGQVRSKFANVPIPGESVTLNGSALISEGKDEQEKLRTELKETLAELTYAKMAETDAAMLENSEKVLQKVPYYVYVG
mgnify:FL=1|jgi:hypothetical protein